MSNDQKPGNQQREEPAHKSGPGENPRPSTPRPSPPPPQPAKK